MQKPKVLLGMSGGVDSSVSAVLLLEQGYEVIGAFMKNWSGSVCQPRVRGVEREEDDVGECGWKQERRDAMRVAAQLGIPFVTFDFETEYRARVVENMFEEFAKGRTPNPDVLCNKIIKFDLFLREADRLGCAFVATGHYARQINGKLLKGVDVMKDQTYFLWAINPAVVERLLFPVGGLQKSEVRAIAQAHHLEVATKKDSTGICFVGEVDMRTFLQERLPKKPGYIVDVDGRAVGKHDGVMFYTIGQREGLGVASTEPLYVVEKRMQTNELVVASGFYPALFRKELFVDRLNWFEKPLCPARVTARIRHRQEVQQATITTLDEQGIAHVTFDDPQRAVTPGQSIVFYEGEIMLGGGIIQ